MQRKRAQVIMSLYERTIRIFFRESCWHLYSKRHTLLCGPLVCRYTRHTTSVHLSVRLSVLYPPITRKRKTVQRWNLKKIFRTSGITGTAIFREGRTSINQPIIVSEWAAHSCRIAETPINADIWNFIFPFTFCHCLAIHLSASDSFTTTTHYKSIYLQT